MNNSNATLVATGLRILAMASATAKTQAALSSFAENDQFLRALFNAHEIVFVAFFIDIDAMEFSFLSVKGDRLLASELQPAPGPERTISAVIAGSFEEAVEIGMRYGDADARGYLPLLTLSRIPPTSRFRIADDATLAAAEERRRRRDAKRAKGAYRG